MTKPYFNTDEFHRLLTKEIGSEDLALQMAQLQNKYQYCIGIVPEDEWETFFDNRAEIHEFKRKHDLGLTMRMYNPIKLEHILIAELNLSKEIAVKFTQCEEAYLTKIGVM